MPPRPHPKYPAPAYTAPLQWTPPSSPAPPNMPLPNLPPYSLPTPEPPVLRWSPLEGPSSRPSPLPTFRANHPSPRPMTLPLTRDRRPTITQTQNTPNNQPPCRRFYLRHETLLLAVLLVLQLAILVILGTVLTHSDWRRCGGGLELSMPSIGPEGVVSQASSDRSQSITPET